MTDKVIIPCLLLEQRVMPLLRNYISTIESRNYSDNDEGDYSRRQSAFEIRRINDTLSEIEALCGEAVTD